MLIFEFFIRGSSLIMIWYQFTLTQTHTLDEMLFGLNFVATQTFIICMTFNNSGDFSQFTFILKIVKESSSVARRLIFY
jgi:hypothetical protein